MDAVCKSRGGANWLLRIFFGVSALTHLFLLVYAIAPFRSEVPHVIELAVKEIPSPERKIPSPPLRSQVPESPKWVSGEVVRPSPIAPGVPLKADAPRPFPSQAQMISAGAAAADATAIPALRIAEWAPQGIPGKVTGNEMGNPAAPDGKEDIGARDQYLGMIRHLIECQKKYPAAARLRKLAGKVVIEFVLSSSGDIKSIHVVEGSRFPILDRAATKAVEDAAPYPRPPAGLYSGSIRLRIPVVFELI